MPLDHQPARWMPPVAPVEVERRFREVAPYAAGGHRGIDLAAAPGSAVRAPCRGVVTFRGRVAGGAPTLTVDCGHLRATLQRVEPSVGVRAQVRAGAVIGAATGDAVDLSARRGDGSYLDPLALLRAAPPRTVPPFAGRPHTLERRTPPRLRPAHLPAGSLISPAGSDSAAWHGPRPGRRSVPSQVAESRPSRATPATPPSVDRWLASAAGAAMACSVLAGLAAAMTTQQGRRRRRRLMRRPHLVGLRR